MHNQYVSFFNFYFGISIFPYYKFLANMSNGYIIFDSMSVL